MDAELVDAVRDRRTARTALDADSGSEEAKDRWVAAKRKAVEVEGGGEEACPEEYRDGGV